jgi:hypothetical protein
MQMRSKFMPLCIQRVSVITLLGPAAKTLGCANCFIKKKLALVIRGELDKSLLAAAACAKSNSVLESPAKGPVELFTRHTKGEKES